MYGIVLPGNTDVGNVLRTGEHCPLDFAAPLVEGTFITMHIGRVSHMVSLGPRPTLQHWMYVSHHQHAQEGLVHSS